MDEKNCPNGRIISIDNAIRKNPFGPAETYLSDYLKGEIFDGERSRDYLLNVLNGDVYLDPDAYDYLSFQKECLKLTEECLGFQVIKEDVENESFFYCAMGADPENYPSIDGYSQNGYVKFAGELVLSGMGDMADYVRDKDRGDIIMADVRGQVQEGTDLSEITKEKILSFEAENGFYFEYLYLTTQDGKNGLQMYKPWDEDERELTYSERDEEK
ncbi:MAG: hypothetical protein IJU50_04835 [Lachnospiraceae bacterium]|nr:hypothetical protein [Lachnospiraceae bacterium]